MAWKRMFSFRATAGQDRPTARRSNAATHPSFDSNISAAKGPAMSDAASVSTTATGVSFSSRTQHRKAIVGRDAQPRDRSAHASVDGQASRPRSLDLSLPASDGLQARSSHSAESLLLFNHSDDSRSTLSLPFSYRSLRGDARPPTPTDAAAASKSADTLPRSRPRPKPRAKRRENTSYSCFMTPLVFTTANPYVMPPAAPPSTPLSTAGSLVAPAQSRVSAEGTPVRDAAPPSASIEEPESEPELPPAIIFKKITGTSRRRLFSRPSADGLTTAPSPGTGSTPPALARWRSQEHPRPPTTSSAFRPTRTQVDTRAGGDDANGLRSVVAPSAATLPENASVAAEERRLHIAVTKVKLDREVREERDVDDVLPKLRMLRAR
ncbi:hypothetical protein DAEQUDRAFT_767917 [Daedalea quercina L-15889]|uniref:Uncharacterized protein n=1 Tax=Daedalea quercina L-15889 TaxID=1314783 RepID=A0A165N675_9APHY|nr:hypothetical protein DAEQUDRAFT_767917 [Daedalea quercina L-15889]